MLRIKNVFATIKNKIAQIINKNKITNHNENKKIEYPRFIENAPCGEDSFAGKSHTRIANCICKTIKSHNNCHMIGLEGDWGSGKSNLLKLVEQQIKNDEEVVKKEKYYFFTYDTWGHKEDVQKRAILEDLTEFLTKDKKPILKGNKWKNSYKALISKNKTTEIIKYSKWTISAVLAFFITVKPESIYNKLLNLIDEINISDNLFRDKIDLKMNSTFMHMIIWVLIFTFVLFLIHSLVGIYFEIKAGNKKLKFCKNKKHFITYETIYEKIPSARDFSNWMHEISEDLGDKNLIIIFDNMDRLSANKVRDLWATIHTFFAENLYDIDYPNIKVIIPFDRGHIQNAFSCEDIKDSEICYGNDFVNKTFDVVYRVSPPILSDWQKYFKEKWNYALGRPNLEKEYKEVLRIYDNLTSNYTPRNINAFINEVAIIKQSSENKVPLQYISLYIFGKKEITKNPDKELFNPTFLKSIKFIYENDKNLTKYLSSIHYQLDPKRVNSILFKDDLRKALENKDFETVKKYKNKLDSFYGLLIDILVLIDIKNYPNVIETLNQNISLVEKKELWGCIYNKVKDKKEDEIQKYHIIVLLNCDWTFDKPSIYLKHIFSLIIETREDKKIESSQYKAAFNKLVNLSNNNAFFRFAEVKYFTPEIFDILIELVKEKFSEYGIYCTPEDLNNYICNKSISELQEVNYIPFVLGRYDLTIYKMFLHDQIKANCHDIDSLYILFTRLKEAEKPILENPLAYEKIAMRFKACPLDHPFKIDLFCMIFAKIEKYENDYRSLFKTVIKEIEEIHPTKELSNAIADCLEYYILPKDCEKIFYEHETELTEAIFLKLQKNGRTTYNRFLLKGQKTDKRCFLKDQ